MKKLLCIESVINIIGTLVNLFFVYLVYKLNKKDSNPKLSLITRFEDKNDDDYSFLDLNTLFNRYYFESNGIDFNLSGFPEIEHNERKWKLEIDNKGEFPAINVRLSISLVIKRVEFDIGIDETDILNEKIVDYKKVTKEIEIDYLPALSKREIDIVILRGDFIVADLVINKLISDEMEYIEKPIKIDIYKHLDLIEGLEDSYHYRKLIGACDKVENRAW